MKNIILIIVAVITIIFLGAEISNNGKFRTVEGVKTVKYLD